MQSRSLHSYLEEVQKEPLSEVARTKLHQDAKSAIPSLHYYPNMNYYGLYRLGIAMAGLPGKEHMATHGPASDFPMTLAYTKADQEIIQMAKKMLGHDSVEISGPESREGSDVNIKSPVPDRKTLRK